MQSKTKRTLKQSQMFITLINEKQIYMLIYFIQFSGGFFFLVASVVAQDILPPSTFMLLLFNLAS